MHLYSDTSSGATQRRLCNHVSSFRVLHIRQLIYAIELQAIEKHIFIFVVIGGIDFIRNCTGGANSPADACQTFKESFAMYNYTYYTSGNTCCVGFGVTIRDGPFQDVTACFCNTDKCNDKIQPNAGLPMKALSKLAIVAVAVIAVLSTIN